jgi:hypothetical protein
MEDFRIDVNERLSAQNRQDPPSLVTDLVACVVGRMTYDQIISIVEKYMQNNPE